MQRKRRAEREKIFFNDQERVGDGVVWKSQPRGSFVSLWWVQRNLQTL